MKNKITFRMPTLGFAIMVAFTLITSGGRGNAAEPDPSAAKPAYEQLVTSDFFAFGGVGIADTTSPGQKAFQTILTSTNALELFRSALKEGNPQARMYALAGIRKLAPKTFDAEAKSALKDNPQIKTMSGCIAREEAAEAVIKRISNGVYDLYLESQPPSVRLKK
jgi:hypothetical protein